MQTKKQTKKLIGIALIAALVGSMTAVSVSARDEVPAEEIADYFSNHTLGIVGAMTDWGNGSIPDVPMTDADGDGVLVGVYRNLAAGSYEFKVRADSAWDDSWGMYEEEYERTMNSQINCSVTVADTTDLIVMLDATGDDSVVWPVTFYSTEGLTASQYGIVGDMTNWGNDGVADVDMYETAEGRFVGVLKNVAAGDHEFKVRVGGSWDKSYGAYQEEYDRTDNSQTNCKVSLENTSDIIVEFDTTGEDEVIWPISYTVIDDAGNVVEAKYTGKEEVVVEESSAEASEVSQASETSETSETSQTSETSETSETSQTSETSETSQTSETSKEESTVTPVDVPDYYETQTTDYIFFDVSVFKTDDTKWNTVYAYWWNSDLGETYDRLSKDEAGNPIIYPDYERDENGEIKLDEEGNKIRNPWPGVEMQKVEGADGIYQIRVPYGATKIIFSSGVKDDDIHAGAIGYQTDDMDFNAEEDKGKVYTIDTSVEAKPGRGIEKTKYKYAAGAWTTYTGVYNAEQIGEPPVEVSDMPSAPEDSQASTVTPVQTSTTGGTTGGTTTGGTTGGTTTGGTTGGTTTGGTTTGGTTGGTTTVVSGKGNSVATGDATMPIAVGAVAVAALGVAVVASKKKSAQQD